MKKLRKINSAREDICYECCILFRFRWNENLIFRLQKIFHPSLILNNCESYNRRFHMFELRKDVEPAST